MTTILLFFFRGFSGTGGGGPVAGPFRLMAAQYYVAGQQAADSYVAGAVKAQAFVAGAQEGDYSA